jgi:hypothetical protein
MAGAEGADDDVVDLGCVLYGDELYGTGSVHTYFERGGFGVRE